jgi:hypothetical protein
MWHFVIYGNNSQLLVPPSEKAFRTEPEAMVAGGEIAYRLAPMLGLVLSVHAVRI